MEVIYSRLLLEQRISSNVSFVGEMMHAFRGTGVEVSFGMWWINGTELGNGNGIFSISGREVEE